MSKKITPPADFDVDAYCAKLAASGTEHGHQRAFFGFLNMEVNYGIEPRAWMAFAVPNGGNRDVVQAARLKMEGVKRGVPDTCWPVPCGQYASLYIELKAQGGTASEDQLGYQKALREQHSAAAICWGWRAAVRCYRDYREGREVRLNYPFEP